MLAFSLGARAAPESISHPWNIIIKDRAVSVDCVNSAGQSIGYVLIVTIDSVVE